MRDVPRFCGIANSNLSSDELWSRETFPRSISVALCNHMRDIGMDLNLVHTEGTTCKVGSIPVDRLYGTETPPSDLTFDFDCLFIPHLNLAHGVPESNLVISSPDGEPIRYLDMQAAVVPDASTREYGLEFSGPEMTFRTPNLKNLILRMSSSLLEHRDAALDLLEWDRYGNIDWSDWNIVSGHMGDIMADLDILQSRMSDLQSPFLLQSIWRSEVDGPLMAEDAMDVFVWTDFAFSRIFLDSTRKTGDGSANRPMRCTVRLYRGLGEILSDTHPDLENMLLETRYGMADGKEFMANGKLTNRYLSCERLTRPAVRSSEIPSLASSGFESMIIPERRLDYSIYHAVRAIRG